MARAWARRPGPEVRDLSLEIGMEEIVELFN